MLNAQICLVRWIIICNMFLVVSFVPKYCLFSQDLTSSTKQSEKDRVFGEKQVEIFLSDRSDVRFFVEKRPDLRSWLAQSFAGADIGMRIHWDNLPPNGGLSCFAPEWAGFPVLVRVTDSPLTLPEDRLVLLIFELCNLRRLTSKVTNQINQDAYLGKIGIEDFARRYLEMEHLAMLDCKGLISRFGLPTQSSHAARISSCPEDFNSFFEGTDQTNVRRYYTTNIAPFLRDNTPKDQSVPK
jgi:hypothetical protein